MINDLSYLVELSSVLYCNDPRVGQTDAQTDRRTPVSWLDLAGIPCTAAR